MICEFRNKLEKYTDFIALGHNRYTRKRKETDIFSFLCFLTLAIVFIFSISWWLLPVRYLVYNPLSNIKFVCNKEEV